MTLKNIIEMKQMTLNDPKFDTKILLDTLLKYFSIFNNKQPASWVAHITRDFLTCYSYSYYRTWYNASLVITGTIRGTSRENLYQELGHESLQLQRWYKEPRCFFKIYNSRYPDCFLIPTHSRQKYFIIYLNSKWNITFLKTRIIGKKATLLLISQCDINQVFYSDLFLLLFPFWFTISRRYCVGVWYLRYFYVLCV